MIHRLFVYGTLAPGRPNEHVLAEVPGNWQPATVTGRLVRQGWGAELGYPAIVLDENGPDVSGFVFESESLDAHWQRLDDFEGPGYERVATVAQLVDGRIADAFVYVLRELPPATGSDLTG
jgi:gamma-glutamylcyclotransferase (GGCT)/AIG2-like uncharacterized protein YtfP